MEGGGVGVTLGVSSELSKLAAKSSRSALSSSLSYESVRIGE